MDKELCAMGKIYSQETSEYRSGLHFNLAKVMRIIFRMIHSENGTYQRHFPRRCLGYGYRDTCNGDSGGPLFSILSREEVCPQGFALSIIMHLSRVLGFNILNLCFILLSKI